MEKAVVLLSGGLDSSVTLAVAARDGFRAHTLTFDYGQRNRGELRAAEEVSASLASERHMVVSLDMKKVGGSALTGGSEVPKDGRWESRGNEIPATYVPARNTIFLSFALAWSEALDSGDIFYGANAVDYSGYPDCRPEYIAAFEEMARRGTKRGSEGKKIRIHAPLLSLSKSEIIRLGDELGVDFSLTVSCYDPPEPGIACGRCDSCLIRKKGFREAGIEDPAEYAQEE